jgi:hypothetical protein
MRRLQGTWRVTVQPFICQTGVPIGQPFASLSTFARGGTMTGATSGAAYLPGQRTPDFGIWSRTDEHTFSAVTDAFILFDSSTPPTFCRPLALLSFPASIEERRGSRRQSRSTTMEFTSKAVTQFFDPDGKLLSRNCATAVAHRFDPPDSNVQDKEGDEQ